MNVQLSALIAAAVIVATPLRAGILVDTGEPTIINGGPIISPTSWLAGKFILDRASTITAIETFHGFNAARPTGSGVTFSIRAAESQFDIPGDLLHSIADSGPTSPGFSGWFGVHDLSWSLQPGSYWVTLEVRSGQDFSGFLAVRPPAPLPFSFFSPFLQNWLPVDQASQLNRPAWRISGSSGAIPEPASWAMLIAGFGLVGAIARRRQTARATHLTANPIAARRSTTMKFKHLAALVAAFASAGAANAAVTTYHVTFDIDEIALPVQRLNGNFSVTLDPEFAPFSNDVAPTDANIWTPGFGFDESFSRVDFYPFASSDPGFLIGWLSGGADTNNTTLNASYDYRVRFILNPDYSIVSARGQVRYWDGLGTFPTIGFDTSMGNGRIATWSIIVDGGETGAVPEPATWAMLIAGFGLVGASARRRRLAARAV